MNLCSEKHMWEITESGEFCEIHCYLNNIIVGIGADRVWAHIYTILYSADSLLNVADVDGGLCTATGTSKCTPPPHPHSLTRLRSDLNFWIQKVKVLENSTSGFSTTSRHPLVDAPFSYPTVGLSILNNTRGLIDIFESRHLLCPMVTREMSFVVAILPKTPASDRRGTECASRAGLRVYGHQSRLRHVGRVVEDQSKRGLKYNRNRNHTPSWGHKNHCHCFLFRSSFVLNHV